MDGPFLQTHCYLKSLLNSSGKIYLSDWYVNLLSDIGVAFSMV
jgi:hypothetical protein